MKSYNRILLTTCLLFSGCAFGTQMNYRDTEISVPAFRSPLGLAVWDQRNYVVSGDKSEQFIGVQRSGWGIPFGVHTASGLPLSVEFRQAIQRGLEKKKIQVIPLDTTVRVSKNEIIISQQKANAPLNLLITIAEWKSDTMNNVSFSYDIIAEVFDKAGNLIAQKRVQGSKDLDASFWNPIGSSERLMNKQQQDVFGEVFSSPEIKGVL
jgi:hypothetical protein